VIRGRQSGKWSFPKGHGESGEAPLDACLRELNEETGVDLSGIKPDDELRFKAGTYFVFYLKEKPVLNPRDTNEVIDSMWVPLNRLCHLNGNMDLNIFSRRVDYVSLVDRIEIKKGIV
jgi:8-oxo-dGTP pyrophosphatase MutT (NUDIX family)